MRARWGLWLGSCVCLALVGFVLDGRGPRAAALAGYFVLSGLAVAAAQRERPGSRWPVPLIVSCALAALMLGVWAGSR